jgi:hypothetical protein
MIWGRQWREIGVAWEVCTLKEGYVLPSFKYFFIFTGVCGVCGLLFSIFGFFWSALRKIDMFRKLDGFVDKRKEIAWIEMFREVSSFELSAIIL